MENINIKNCLNCKKEPCDAITMANCIITQRGEWQITDSFFAELIEKSKKYDALQASEDKSKLLLTDVSKSVLTCIRSKKPQPIQT